MISLRGNVHAAARGEYEMGLTDAARRLTHVSINFKPSSAQQAELDQLLLDQQDPASPAFHAWLTPEEYGERFGMDSGDLAAAADWLRNAGLQVTATSAARNWIAADGTVEALQRAFHTEIHNYRVNGETHFANSSEPSVPAAFAESVSSITGLNDFHPVPAARRAYVSPKDTLSGGTHILAPADYATIYDINPLYAAGYDGTGQNLAILGESDINLADIAAFRSAAGLPAIKLQQILVPGTTDPGHVADPEGEADLDLEWSGAVAKNANIIYIYAPNVGDAAGFAISPPAGTPIPARVVSYSFGLCEPHAGSDLQAWQTLINQANAEGITFIASSGDSGAAGCDRQAVAPLAAGGVSVQVPASVPGVTAVGGTQFNEGAGTYWNNTNVFPLSSALSYIPEIAWNESGAGGLAASGGGVSTYYPRPAWQSLPGVPAGNYRAVPDVALAAAVHDGYLWVSSSKADCSASSSQVCWISGTSASAPSFAGMIAILNQYAASKGLAAAIGGQGNINPTLYKLYVSTPNAFHDIVTGSNIVNCQIGTANCTTGSFGYSAGAGYDPVTGLGSVDANNLITQWYQKSVTASTVSVVAAPAILTTASSTVLTAKVTSSGGTPTGSVAFGITGKTFGTATLSAGTATLTIAGSQFAVGSNPVTAVYSGDSNFSGSSASASVFVSLPTNASAVIPRITPNPVLQQTPNAAGYTWFFTVTLSETAGTATTLTGLTIGGVDYSGQIVSFFGTGAIAAKGGITASLGSKGYTAPTALQFVFSGADADGQTWKQTASVTLLGPQTAAAMSLASAPSTVYRNPAAAANCQWTQNLQVQELNGFGVTLTRFLAGGFDLSSQIGDFFGSSQLNALGSLQAGLCWTQIPAPVTLSYELDGIDVNGNSVKASATVAFAVAPSTVTALSLSKSAVNLQLPSPSQSASAAVAVNVAAGVPWSVSTFPANQTTSWLSVVPSAGVGPGTVTITAPGSGLSNSIYKATLTFQAPAAVPAFVNLPVSLTIGANPVVINPGGVVPVYSTSAAIQAGSWASIYGSNLAAAVAVWNGDFPTTLGGVTVTVNGKLAYLWFVSPGQINFQVPADATSGPVNVLVANSFGTASTTVVLSQQGPSFLLIADNKHVTGLIVDLNGGGSQGGGSYDLLGPASAGPGFRPARPGDLILLYGLGFGATNPSVPPGKPYTCPANGCATLVTNPQITVGGVPVKLDFAGIVEAGLYQFNFTMPANIPSGDQVLKATVNGVATPANVLFPVQ